MTLLTGDLNHLTACLHQHALCGKPGADDPSSMLANEAAAVDEQRLVGALPTAASGLVVWSPCQLRADIIENIVDGLLWFLI
jgi:hypothetical protein